MLTPYHTTTPSTVKPTATIKVAVPVTPAPTATPFLHTITNDDTMLGIAFKYGISLEELQAANPGVDSHYLSVGKQLVIPLSGEIPEIVPTPTPVGVRSGQPYCYRTGDGGAWCIMEVRNELESDVENLSAWIGLFSLSGNNIINSVAFAPLDILHPGDTTPLMVYFSPPLPEEFIAQANLLSAITLPKDDGRYITLITDSSNLQISADGSQATISGEVILGDEDEIPSQVWILAVAYDSDGKIVGARKWESMGDLQYSIIVFSLGGMIDHVDLLMEARP